MVLGMGSRYKEVCLNILLAGASGRLVLVTSAETLQELLHRYCSIGRGASIGPVFAAVNASMWRILPVTAEDLEEARRLGEMVADRAVAARDLVHAAVARRQGLSEILTVDKGFACIPGASVVDPLEWRGAG